MHLLSLFGNVAVLCFQYSLDAVMCNRLVDRLVISEVEVGLLDESFDVLIEDTGVFMEIACWVSKFTTLCMRETKKN